jgi:hypothetical protein
VNSNCCCSPICRYYVGLTPPNPRFYNRGLRKDYIDWYMNVYMEAKEKKKEEEEEEEEEFPWERV